MQHQRRSIPEIAALEELTGRRTTVENAVRDHRIEVADLTAEVKRADADVTAVRNRRERDQGMVDAGKVNDPKALQRMLGELESLHRRIGDLEDTEIEVMERLEEAQSALDARTAELTAMDERATRLAATRDHSARGFDEDIARVAAERKTAVDGMPADLLALYEKLRASKGGVGAAALRRKECGGCRLTLNPSDLAIITKAPTDDVIRCEECGRILVRTGESGL